MPITDHIEFNAKGRAICPSCAASKGAGHRKLNLSLVPGTDGAYKCHAGCTPEDIKAALGITPNRQIPTALAKPNNNVTISPEQVMNAHRNLLNGGATTIAAMNWLKARGITEAMVSRYRLGIGRAKVDDKHLPCITVPIPANAEGTSYYQKKRVAPWFDPDQLPTNYKPWSQYGIPARTFITWLPSEAKETWLCEGEWDAIMLGTAARQAELPVAIASFTCGCRTVPPKDQLDLLPGKVTIFYDRNDKPDRNGKRPGEAGAQELAAALGERAAIGLVPMPENCDVKGWDVSDALNHGFTIADFTQAAAAAQAPQPASQEKRRNPLLDRLRWNDDLIANAPDVIEWLVPDLLTQNELFLLAAGPRAGKSLMAMSLAKAVATGGEFLGRPCTQGPVLYVCLEDSDTKIKEREQAQGWSEGLPVAWLQKFKLSELADLRDIVEDMDPRLIILDTLSRIKDGSISESSAEMSQILEPLQEMAKEMDCCILLVHHTGKVNVDNAGKIEVFDTIRGSSAIRAVCRGTLIIAADERNYRLFAENGWGKHDLAIVLDANTLEWKLLGKWEPIADGSQKDAVKEFLIQHGSATFEQIAAALDINKRQLSVILSRMQKSENAAEKVVKTGQRRAYRYSIALSNTIYQLDKLLDSENPLPVSDEGLYLTKNTFSLPPSKSDHLPKSDQTGTCDALITFSPDYQEDLLDKGVKTAETQSGQAFQLSNSYLTLSNSGNQNALPEPVSSDSSYLTDLSNTCDPLKMVTVLSNATWFRQGSDSIPRRAIPRSLHKADSLTIDKLDTPMFEELIGDSELLGYSTDGKRAKVRNLETNRISVFATKDILFLRGGSHANG